MGRITLEKVQKKFGEVEVIPPLDLTIEDGEFVVFVGPSGCGKSTLLRLIAGLEDVSGGEIRIDGKPATDLPPAKRGLAMVFQSYALYPHMTVRKNIAFPMKMAGLPEDEQKRRIDNAAKALNLTDYLDRRPGQLSGGQRQRVAIGRALVRDVDVFLFDEPLSNLDAKLRADLRVEIKKLHGRLGNTMIYVTHDQVEAMTLADRIAIMKNGRIMQLAPPHEVYSRPANLYVAGFIGSPAMNLIEGELAGDTFRANGLTIPVAAYDFAPGSRREGRAVIGLRPEHIATGTDLPLAAATTRVTVELVEPMGSDTLVYAPLAGRTIHIRMDGQAEVRPGDEIEIGFQPERASLFDPDTELRL